MIYNYISVFYIVEKLYRDYPTKGELEIWDVVEWAGEAMELIGASLQLENVPNKVLTVAEYKAKLPCELITLNGVKYNGAPMLYASGVYGPTTANTVDQTENSINSVDVDDENFPMLGTSTGPSFYPFTYYPFDGYLHTDLQSGEITISYQGIKVDKDGYPMIPDKVEYKQAISNYVQMMIDRRAWRSGSAPEAHYRDSQRNWSRMVKQARGAAAFPSIDKMETIKRMWLRLKPSINAHNTGFTGLITPSSKQNG